MEEPEVKVESALLASLTARLRLLENLNGDRVDAEAALCRAKIRILEAGGKAPIRRLLNRKGADTGATLIPTRFGSKWKFPDGTWVADKPATLRRLGLRSHLARVNAWASLRGATVDIYPTVLNFLERDRE